MASLTPADDSLSYKAAWYLRAVVGFFAKVGFGGKAPPIYYEALTLKPTFRMESTHLLVFNRPLSLEGISYHPCTNEHHDCGRSEHVETYCIYFNGKEHLFRLDVDGNLMSLQQIAPSTHIAIKYNERRAFSRVQQDSHTRPRNN